MIMTPGLRKFVLTSHVTSSVSWLGAVAAFLALAIAGLRGQDGETVRAVYIAMHLTTWFVIVPLSLAALLTGLVQSLGTTWGLFRHYWIVAKLWLTVLATGLLLLHTQPIGRVAAVARDRMLSSSDLRQLRIQLVADAGAALFVLLITTALSVYKPWGMTAYGLRRQNEETSPWRTPVTRRSALWRKYVLVAIIGFVVLVIVWHLVGGGLHGH
jgi:hypothetical protein